MNGEAQVEMRRAIGVIVVVLAVLLAVSCSNQEHTNPFDPATVPSSTPTAIPTATLGPNAFVAAWGSSGTGDGQFADPTSLAVSDDFYVYITDSTNNRIQKFDSDGNYLSQWGSLGAAAGQFDLPEGIATDETGNVYVCDRNNDRAQKFDANGAYLLEINGSTTAQGFFCGYFRGGDTNGSGRLYLSDYNFSSGGGVMLEYDCAGNLLKEWGVAGMGDGQFSWVQFLDVHDSDGFIYTAGADGAMYRVQKFDSAGDFLLTWGDWGTADGQFLHIVGIATNPAGDVFVLDKNRCVVQRFDADGNFIRKWGGSGTDPGEFINPQGIAVDKLGCVYIADTSNNRIQKFAP